MIIDSLHSIFNISVYFLNYVVLPIHMYDYILKDTFVLLLGPLYFFILSCYKVLRLAIKVILINVIFFILLFFILILIPFDSEDVVRGFFFFTLDSLMLCLFLDNGLWFFFNASFNFDFIEQQTFLFINDSVISCCGCLMITEELCIRGIWVWFHFFNGFFFFFIIAWAVIVITSFLPFNFLLVIWVFSWCRCFSLTKLLRGCKRRLRTSLECWHHIYALKSRIVLHHKHLLMIILHDLLLRMLPMIVMIVVLLSLIHIILGRILIVPSHLLLRAQFLVDFIFPTFLEFFKDIFWDAFTDKLGSHLLHNLIDNILVELFSGLTHF